MASGRTDVVIEAAIAIWDIAALKVIVEEAGGFMTDIKGDPVNKEISTVIATNKALHNKVLEFFK